jgi:CheY-like chemotaxis protein
MALNLRGKLIVIVSAAALAFVVLIVAGTLIERRVARQLATIQERYVPRVGLGPQLEGQFERIRRGLQDAVAAQDSQQLVQTRTLLIRFLEDLAAAGDAVSAEDARALRGAIEDYYATALDVSRRLIAGEKGEMLVDAMAAMQSKHSRASQLLFTATAIDRAEMGEAFSVAARAQATAAQVRLVISGACLVVVILLSLALGRGVLRSLRSLSEGMRRFGGGDFERPIPTIHDDEIGAVAKQANQMAASLKRLGEERDRTDWLRNGAAGLAQELRGDLEPQDVAMRAVRFLARTLDAPLGALYFLGEDRTLRLLGGYALSGPEGGPPAIAVGEGLLGQAALGEALVVISDPPADYLRVRSGLGEGAPRALVLAPLTRNGRVTGVLELAVFRSWTEQGSQLLLSTRETLAIALEVAHGRAALREMLAETQRQAQRLLAQEEELRSTNEELQSQQEELRQANDEMADRALELERQRQSLQQTNTELVDARRRLEQKAAELATVSTYKSQFLANMSHELRTPLNSMLLLSNLLSRNEAGNLTEKQVEFCKTVYGAGQDLLALINQVLDLAKIESGKQEVELEPVSLKSLAAHMERVFGPLARDKGLRLVIEVGAAPETISTDRRRLDQILNNLLGNAIKFTERGEVALRIGRPGPVRLTRTDLQPDTVVAFAVSDTGIGIPPEFQQKVFEPFEQVEATSDRRYGGTGLGLPISRELAALLGGELQLHAATELGRGSTFVLYLPENHPKGAPGPRPPAPPPSQIDDDRAELRPGDPHLLVIEDDPIFATALGAVIREQGLKYVAAESGEGGFRLARERKPTGIILDVKLPDVDGWAVMERLRADPATAQIPVHFLSADGAGERGMALGAVGYLTKPAARRDLVRVIERLAPRPAERSWRVLVVEDDVDMADSLVRRLADEKVEARRAASARDAINALGETPFDCLILDLSLPDMDGLQLLEQVMEHGGESAPPVVVYTGRQLTKAEAKRAEQYAEAVVLKEGPSSDRLLAEIRVFLRRLEDRPPARRRTSRELPVFSDLKGRRALVVDDDMRTVYALSALLRSRGMEVVVADTGEVALTTLTEHPEVEIVLMDVMMPKMDGYEAVRRIRQEPAWQQLPVIALTAKAMKGDRERCLQSGATDYLPKPIDSERLLAMIQTHLPLRSQNGA